MTVLHLVRHGETDWNRDGRVQGSSDVPLNDLGRRQAREAAARFAAMPAAPSVMATSDLARARETAAILAETLGLATPRPYADLRERGYGESEGMRAEEVVARFGDWRTSQIPGAGPWADLRARAVGAVQAVVRDVGATVPEGSSVLVVTHGALIRELVRHVTDDRLPAPGTRLGNLEGVQVRVAPDRMLLLDAAPASSR